MSGCFGLFRPHGLLFGGGFPLLFIDCDTVFFSGFCRSLLVLPSWSLHSEALHGVLGKEEGSGLSQSKTPAWIDRCGTSVLGGQERHALGLGLPPVA